MSIRNKFNTYVVLPLPVGPRTAFTPGRNIPLQIQQTHRHVLYVAYNENDLL